MSLLYPQPEGALMDPRSQLIMQTGLGLLAAGGPQSTPMGLGQAFGQAGAQGLNAYQQALRAQQAQQQAQQQEAFRQLQMKKMEEQLRLQQEEAARRSTQHISAGPGTQLFRPGENAPFHTVPFRPEPTPPTPEPRAPMTRRVKMGDQEVTQEYVNGAWQEVGRGPAFAKSVETPAKPAVPPKPPKDYQWTDDTYTQVKPIKDGPKDTAPRDAARAAGAVQKADIVIGKVDEALKNTGFTSTGLTGKVLGMVPGTKAYDLDKTIDTIKAQIGFSELQAMREASPTGGALGQVAVQELSMLQSTIASLEHGQSEEQVRRALGQVKKHFENWKRAVQQSQQGQAPTAPEAPKRKVYNPKSGKFE